jgi:hypothetical protein
MRQVGLSRTVVIILFAVSTLALSSCSDKDSGMVANASPDTTNKNEVATASTPDEFELSPERLTLLSAKGLDGDGEAAYRVYLHYVLGWSQASSSAEQERWLTYAVENWYEQAWFTRAQDLLRDRTGQGCRRAAYWLRRLLDSDSPSMVQKARRAVDLEKKYWSKSSPVPICNELAKL